MSVLKAPDNPQQAANLDERRLEAGVLGKLFGTGENAAKNIAGLVILTLIVGGLVAYFYERDEGGLFQIAVPIVTLALGYLFGQKISDIENR